MAQAQLPAQVWRAGANISLGAKRQMICDARWLVDMYSLPTNLKDRSALSRTFERDHRLERPDKLVRSFDSLPCDMQSIHIIRMWNQMLEVL